MDENAQISDEPAIVIERLRQQLRLYKIWEY
jgi:hypothetical protein